MKVIVNATGEKIAAYFNGQGVYFKSGQGKSLEDGPADEIVRETDGLYIKGTEPKEPVVEEVAEVAPVVEVPAKKKPAKKK